MGTETWPVGTSPKATSFASGNDRDLELRIGVDIRIYFDSHGVILVNQPADLVVTNLLTVKVTLSFAGSIHLRSAPSKFAQECHQRPEQKSNR